MYLILNFDILPGKMNECDSFIRDKLVPYWSSHKEVHSVQCLEDMFIGWPERSVMVEVDDLASLQRIMSSRETHQMREDFTSCATDITTQIMDVSLFQGKK